MVNLLMKEKVAEVVSEFLPYERDFGFDNDVISYKQGNSYQHKHLPIQHIEFVKNYVKSRLDKYLPKDVDLFLAGGSVMGLLLTKNPMTVSDFDLYSTSPEQIEKAANHFKTNGFEHYETKFAHNFSCKKRNLEIDLIKKPHETIEHVLKSFDFNVCCFGFDLKNYSFYKECLWSDLFNLRLKINNIEKIKSFTLADFFTFFERIVKYAGKGFEMSAYDRNTLATIYEMRIENPEGQLDDKKFSSILKIKEKNSGKHESRYSLL